MSVGIDIGSKTIKVVELSWTGDVPSLKSAAVIGMKDASIEKMQDEVEFTNLASKIKKLFADAKISSKEVYIGLPESQVFTRSIKFPPLTDQEIASAVKWQAEEIVPIPIKEAIFQHIILERRENTQPPEVLVLVVAAPRTLVEKYIKILSLAGLTVTGVETELIALTRSLGVPAKTSLVVSLGAKSTDIAVAKNAKLVFSRTISTAGDALTRIIAQTMGIDPAQAEEYKKTYGFSNQLEGKVANAITPVFKIIVEEIKKAINFYQTDEKGDAPSVIVLSGGSAGIPEIVPTLTKMIGIEVVMGNPFSKVTVDPQVLKNLKSYAPLYGVAVGLALKVG